MFTLVAFSESQDLAGSYGNIAAVADQHVHVNGDTIYVPDFANKLVGYYFAGGAKADSAYLDAPSLRRVAPHFISPIQTAIKPSGAESFVLRGKHPLNFEIGEGIKIYENSNPDAGEYHTLGLWLSDKVLAEVTGEIFTVKATASITGVNGTWENGAITFNDVLPVGTYAIIGAHVIAANAIFFRFVPVGSMHRPGGLISANIGAKGLEIQRMGGIGEWCRFHTTTPPSLDILTIDTCTAQTLYLDIVKV